MWTNNDTMASHVIWERHKEFIWGGYEEWSWKETSLRQVRMLNLCLQG